MFKHENFTYEIFLTLKLVKTIKIKNVLSFQFKLYYTATDIRNCHKLNNSTVYYSDRLNMKSFSYYLYDHKLQITIACCGYRLIIYYYN